MYLLWTIYHKLGTCSAFDMVSDVLMAHKLYTRIQSELLIHSLYRRTENPQEQQKGDLRHYQHPVSGNLLHESSFPLSSCVSWVC